MKKRRGQTIRTMEAMSVLDIARGLEDEGDEESGGKKGSKRKEGKKGEMSMVGGDDVLDYFSD